MTTTWFFSPTERGFYTPEIHASIPGDAVQITAEQRAALLAGQAMGYTIGLDDSGMPALVAAALPVTPPIRRIAALAFRKRLPPETRAAITLAAHAAAAAGDATLQTFLADLSAARFVDLDDAEVIAGVAAFQAAGLITAGQATALLADGAPDERP